MSGTVSKVTQGDPFGIEVSAQKEVSCFHSTCAIVYLEHAHQGKQQNNQFWLAGCGKSARPVGTGINLYISQSVKPTKLEAAEEPRKGS